DDDTQRTLDEKIAEAAQRYRERIGFEPTPCELNAAQAAAPTLAKVGTRRSPKLVKPIKPTVPPHNLSLIPTEHLRPNYFLVGLAEGEQPRRVPGWRDPDEDDRDEPSPKRSARATAVAVRHAAASARTRSKSNMPSPPARAATEEGAKAETTSPPSATVLPSTMKKRLPPAFPARSAKAARSVATKTATATQAPAPPP